MVFSPGDPIKAQTADLEDFVASAKPKSDWTAQFNTEQVFRLIDSILPFEACLYHQLLPLSLEGSHLKLGMVNLDDTAALDYVRRILAYMNCSLVPQPLATDVHHAALSAYLSYTGSQKQPLSRPTTARAIAAHTGQRLTKEAAKNGVSDAKVAAIDAEHPHLYQDSHPTFLVDSPEDLNFQDLDIAPPPAPPPAVLTPAPAPVTPVPVTPVEARSIAQETKQETMAPDRPLDRPKQADPLRETFILKPEQLTAKSTPPEISIPSDALPNLSVEPKHLSEPIAVLANLPPAELLVELLGRLLIDGIGRLYFERQAQHGRILWSQNGVLQSVLEELPLDVIQGVINELKLLTHLPLIPVQKPKQVEIERLHQKQRLLLRLRVMPGAHGEEATVQVLRGAALKFYQQQQLASLSRDALTIAQKLQYKVNEIRARTRFYPLHSPDQMSILPALDQVLKSVEEQLEELKALQSTAIKKEENESY
ncbi:hypothetical protein [Stenomitos frigidus]|uniref:ATPase, T2SS/T4P/T4SS family n=1 Tax=Stenomitos frigidus TaxID=1886765 RepID=UPI001C627463|nr:hypothetical protein [Stenomitos frigidus]